MSNRKSLKQRLAEWILSHVKFEPIPIGRYPYTWQNVRYHNPSHYGATVLIQVLRPRREVKEATFNERGEYQLLDGTIVQRKDISHWIEVNIPQRDE